MPILIYGFSTSVKNLIRKNSLGKKTKFGYDAKTTLPEVPSSCNRGLQFYTFFGILIGITWRMIDICKKITFYFLQNF
jgi:hypothetical protein